MNSNKIIIAIDFGTTYSGVAWAHVGNPEHRGNIRNWPLSKKAQDGMNSDKVPTLLRYTGSRGFEWGSQVSEEAPEEQVLKLFKLDLDPSIKFRGQEAVLGDRFRSKNPQALVSDYLRGLGEHIRYYLSKSIGKEYLEENDLEFVITVPAVWTERATQRTIDACRQAGELFSNARIHVVSEPEAAAMYTIASLPPKSMKGGDSFVICDAGGGTVDLISYTIAKTHPVLELKEVTAGAGAFCGSIFLNQGFEDFFKKKLTELIHRQAPNEELVKEALTQFEHRVKRRFTTTSDNFVFKFSAGTIAPSETTRLGKLVITAAELKAVFEPIVSEIIKLVKDQITASGVTIRKVFLVGGFGSSTYLRERLQNALDDIVVIHPENSWLAVVNGAVMKGLELGDPERLTTIKVRERVARKHLGTPYNIPYCPVKHASYEDERFWSSYHGEWRIEVMDWFLKRGDTVSEEEPFSKGWFQTRSVSYGHPTTVLVTIYSDDVGRPAPFLRDGIVQELCTAKMDLGQIPEHKLDRGMGADGLYHYQISFKLEWVYNSKTAAFTMIHKDKRYDTVTVEYV